MIKLPPRKSVRRSICRAATIAIWSLLALPMHGRSQNPDNGWRPLEDAYSASALDHLLIPIGEWKPYPSVSDPDGFSHIDARVRQAYIHAGERYLHASWPALPATVFLEFVRTGNRTDYETLSFQRRKQLADLVLAEAFERKGRFIDQIINGIWAISEESFWGVPAHMFLQQKGGGLPDPEEPVVDLFAAETAQELAWTYYLLKPELDKVTPVIAERIRDEATRRILIPYLKHDNWSYLGMEWKKHPSASRRVNNWNPWINSNVLVTALLLAPDATLRDKVVYKTMESVDNFVIPYPADGGSDEGPEYWGRAAGSLLDYLETLKNATGGKIDRTGVPLLRNMGDYIWKTYIAGPYYYNYGDADALYKPDPALLYRFGRDTRDSVLMRFAAFQAKAQGFGDSLLDEPFGVLNRTLASLVCLDGLKTISPAEALPADVWLPDLQIMAAREQEGSREELYLAVKGGNNGESHNHNDVGSFIVYDDGKPVFIDAGAQTYTAQTFGPDRYKLWNNQSSYHNLPEINGYMQKDGARYQAEAVSYKHDRKSAALTLDIAHAYPDEAGIKSWKRTVSLERGRGIRIEENYVLNRFLASPVFNFLTPLLPDTRTGGVVVFHPAGEAGPVRLHYPSGFTVKVDTVYIRDGTPVDAGAPQGSRTGRLYSNWGGVLYRVRLLSTATSLKNRFIFTID